MKTLTVVTSGAAPKKRVRPRLRRAFVACALALASLLTAGVALADARYCNSRDVIQFGNRSVGTSTTENVTVSNCGDRAWSFTDVSVHPATGAAFHVGTTCATGLTLAPGQSCAIAVTFAPQAAGQTSGGLWLHNTTSTPDQIVTFYGRGIDGQAATSTLAFVPGTAAFAPQEVGSESAPIAIDVKNLGPAPITPSAMVINGPAGYEFPALADTCRVGGEIAAGASCRILVFFAPTALGNRYGNLVIDAPQLASLAIMQLSGVGVAALSTNVGGMWWNAPAGSESGWGINLAHQGDTIFATWFTFGLDGGPLWLAVAATKTGTNVYSGTLYTGTGPPLGSVPFDPAQVVKTPAGSATFTFIDAGHATFAYTVGGVSGSKAIVREVFASPVPTCTWASSASAAAATNFQDLWWASPGGSESGWGINLTHQGDTIFATWFTYGADGKPLWLVFAAPRSGASTYSGTVYAGSGPPFNAVPFDPAQVTKSAVGSATLTFSDGNNATFAYTIGGISGARPITRQVFVPPGTLCH
jgi:hypothetical protein